MSSHPPHLPSKSSSLQQRRAIQTIPWLLVFMALSAMIATTISTAFLAWYVPDFVSYYVPAVISNRQTVSSERTIDPLLSKYIQDRTVNIYRPTASNAQVGVLTAANRIGQGIILSSDGWIALTIEGTLPQGSVVLDADGKIHTIDTVKTDPTNGITYAKISGGNFLVSSFSNWNQGTFGTTMVILDQWGLHTTFSQERIQQQSAANISFHRPYRTIAISSDSGSIVFDETGNVLGFVLDGTLIPSWQVSHALPAILAGIPTQTIRSGYQGVLIEAYIHPLNGVYVEDIALQVTNLPTTQESAKDNTLQKGDIIIALDGMPVDIDTFARIWSSPKMISVRILRDGEYRLIELSP
jgi:S1-C subfamily serine protease